MPPCGLIHIESVSSVPETFSDGELSTVSRSSAPSNRRPPPYFPAVHVGSFWSVAVFPCPVTSVTVVPRFSLKPQPASSPAGGGGAVLDTVTVTELLEVPVLPAASRARACSVCKPFDTDVVSHVMEYGAVVSSAPRLAPSRRNWTPATPTLSVAVAETVTFPETTDPAAGAVTVAPGGVVSGAAGWSRRRSWRTR